MFNKSKTNNANQSQAIDSVSDVEDEQVDAVAQEVSEQVAAPAPTTTSTPPGQFTLKVH